MTNTRQLEPSDFEGASLGEMRGWVEGRSPEALHEKSEEWKAEDQYLRDLKVRVEDALKSANASMQSESGEAMQNQAMPVVLWTEVTAENAKAQSQLMTDQGEAFSKVQSSIPGKGEEQDVPDNGWLEDGWDSFWNGQTDAEAAKEHNEKLRQEAVQAFQTYQSTSQSTVAASSVFDPPPASGMNVAVAGSNHPTVGGVPTVSNTPSGTGSQWTGGGGTGGVGGGGSSTVPSGYSGGSGGFGSGGTGGGGGGYGTTPVWQRPGQGGPGQSGPGGGRVPTGPGTGQPGVPGMALGPGGGSGTGAGAGGRVPGAGGAGGRGFGAGGAGGAGGRGAGSGLGAGGRAGAGGLGGAGGTGTGSGAGGAGGAGGRGGMAGAGAAAGRPQGKQGEEDQEHETPEFLKGDHGFFDDDMPKVAPPVFGDWDQQK